ncbi:alpha/beta fold hydrolase [Sorangium sp. So ce136]|uniref:alpha/beta fold hydrolase n=1 Tax=Sorangium sp. So ce136 TaxID=3133284 RepID=UPI003EFDC018
MKKTTSRDGTTIAFDQTGQGAPVILVMGAFNDRTTGVPLAAHLARRFTVLAYDRRGRGDSGDAATYAIDREVEDLDAVIQAAGGAAAVFGYSSGARLALAAAARGLAITRLALYETPPVQPAEHTQALASLVAAGRRGDAVEYFQRRMVGIPDEVVVQLRHAPFRPALEAMAHTLVYDATIVADGRSPAALAEVRQPALAIAGGAGAPVMRQVAETLAAQLPGGRAVTIEGATHDIAPALLAPVLEPFLDG